MRNNNASLVYVREKLQRKIYNEEMKQKKKEMKLIKKGLKGKDSQ